MTAQAADVADDDADLGAVIFSCMAAREEGRTLDRDQLKAIHPEFAAELEEFFDNQERLERLAAPLREVVSAAETWRTVRDLPLAPPLSSLALGDYELLREIGRGGMGVVYQAHERGLNRTVALKRIAAGQLAGPRERDRFRAEAEMAASLDHPHIVPIYEVGETEEQLFFSMKLLDGNLNGQLERFRNDPRAAARLLVTIADAVHFAHERGILHRDLKPSNILMDGAGRPYVSDFGLAKRVRDEMRDERGEARGENSLDSSLAPPLSPLASSLSSLTIVGSPLYMAPEQARPSLGPVTTATDVYGLGGILYALLTGQPPFQGATILETLERVMGRDPEPPRRKNPSVNRDLETICLKCLEKDPARRYRSARALADDLEAFLTGRPIVARPVGAWERARKWARRQPGAAAVVGFLVLAVCGAIAGVSIHNIQLQHAIDDAKQQRAVADGRYQAARGSLAQIVNDINHPKIADVPRLQELRLQALEHALEFYKSVLEQADDPDPVVRRDAAFAYAETGAIQFLLGRTDPASESFQRAFTLLAGLPADVRQQPECRVRLAVCHSHLGVLAFAARHPDDAERHYRAELTLLEELTPEEPGNPDWQNELARADHHLGRFFLETGRNADAEKLFLRAGALRRPLVAAHPNVDAYQVHLAETCINLAVVQSMLGRKSDGPSPLQEAIDLLRPVVARRPEVLGYKLSLAGAYSNAGQVLKDKGKPREGLKQLDLAVELAEAALRQEPQHQVAIETAFNAHGTRAQINESLHDWPAAVKDWDRVVALDRQPNPWARRNLRAVTLARAGDHARAVAEADALKTEPTINGDGLYNLLCVYALSAQAVPSTRKLPPGQPHPLAEEYKAKAIELLERLRADGYFKDAKNAWALATDTDFLALRGRADFQRLHRQIVSGKK